MTIEEFKAKLDEYLGMIGELGTLREDKWSVSHLISYNAPSGVPIVTYCMVRSKIHKDPHGWYESGSHSECLPLLDPDTQANREAYAITDSWHHFV